MPTRTVTVAAEVGLHAKPAGMIAALVREEEVPVTIALAHLPEATVDASNPLEIMTLGADKDDLVVVACDDGAVLQRVVELIGQPTRATGSTAGMRVTRPLDAP